ncbi:MAG TPA: hypothetical protein VM935_04390 [Chitinophagaceae bacterium]|nr:hypothetical protein [Chitinophagaceae bacterium]
MFLCHHPRSPPVIIDTGDSTSRLVKYKSGYTILLKDVMYGVLNESFILYAEDDVDNYDTPENAQCQQLQYKLVQVKNVCS